MVKALPFFCVLLACSGVIGDPNAERNEPNAPGPGVDRPEISEIDEPAVAMFSAPRRLTPTQYAYAVRDLFAGQIDPGVFNVINVGLAESGYSTDPGANEANEASVRQLFEAAEDAAQQSIERMETILPCAGDAPGAACVDEFIDRYVARAYRRPLTSEERTEYQDRYTAARAADFSDVESIAVLVVMMLQSAPFLYVTEGVAEPRDGRIPLNSFEIATRLSMTFSDSIPDDELWQAAVDDRLHDRAEIARHARRLLLAEDQRFARRFLVEWLHLEHGELSKDAATFPGFNQELARSFFEELERAFDQALRSDATLGEFLTMSAVPMNAALAEHYGVAHDGSAEWVNVALPPEYQSLLARPAFTASHASIRDTSFVHRGLTVMTQILCANPGAPPPNADMLEPEYPDMASARERSEILQASSGICAGCHRQIDNIGLALENYDAIGQWRDLTPEYEGSQSIDDSGRIDASGALESTDVAGESFEGAAGLAELLATSEDVKTCVAEHWFRYATHRGAVAELDWQLIAEMRREFVSESESITSLLIAITQSDAFQYRALPEVSE